MKAVVLAFSLTLFLTIFFLQNSLWFLYITPLILLYAQIVVSEKEHIWIIMNINGLCSNKHQILHIIFYLNLQLGSSIIHHFASDFPVLYGPAPCAFQSMFKLQDVVSTGNRTCEGTVATVKDTVRAFSPLIMTLRTFTCYWPSMKKNPH